MKTLVVIPTYNEKENIADIITAVLNQGPDIDVLVVDDNSPDGTADIVEGERARSSRVHLLKRPGKMGLGSAYIAGFQWALERDYEVVFEMDADFSHDPGEIPEFLQEAADCDLVLGTRYKGGVRVLNWPMSRLILSYSANIFARVVTGMPFTDLTGGYKCFRRATLRNLDLERIRSNGYSFQIEVTYLVWKSGARIVETPIVFEDRKQGRSKMSTNIVIEAFLILLNYRLKRLFGIKP